MMPFININRLYIGNFLPKIPFKVRISMKTSISVVTPYKIIITVYTGKNQCFINENFLDFYKDYLSKKYFKFNISFLFLNL